MVKKELAVIKIIGAGIVSISLLVILGLIADCFIAIHRNISPSNFLYERIGRNDCLFLFNPSIALYVLFIFFIFLMSAGIGIIRLKEWGRKSLIIFVGLARRGFYFCKKTHSFR